MIWLVYLLIGIGMVFQALGSIALHRFPDVYTRLHGATKCTTFGSIFIYIGIMAYSAMLVLQGQINQVSLLAHTLIVMALVLITNSTGAHAISRAAYRSGIKPGLAVVDELRVAK